MEKSAFGNVSERYKKNIKKETLYIFYQDGSIFLITRNAWSIQDIYVKVQKYFVKEKSILSKCDSRKEIKCPDNLNDTHFYTCIMLSICIFLI